MRWGNMFFLSGERRQVNADKFRGGGEDREEEISEPSKQSLTALKSKRCGHQRERKDVTELEGKKSDMYS